MIYFSSYKRQYCSVSLELKAASALQIHPQMTNIKQTDANSLVSFSILSSYGQKITSGTCSVSPTLNQWWRPLPLSQQCSYDLKALAEERSV